jgi:8-oxo-dGTP pyrophosphatase MutT (NUDIX family)
MIISENKLLLVRDWIGSGKWSLPGGGMHKAEDPKVCAVREVGEEVGVNLTTGQLNFLETINYRKKRSTSTRHIYSVELKIRPDIKLQKYEIIEAGWFSLEELGNINLADDVKFILTHHNNLLKS